MSGNEYGTIHPLNDDGIRLIDELSLDAPKITRARRRFIEFTRSFENNDRPMILVWMGFPEDLPDLSSVCPQPSGNLLPDGVTESWYERRSEMACLKYTSSQVPQIFGANRVASVRCFVPRDSGFPVKLS